MRPLPLLASCFVLSLHAQDAPIDTSAVIARIEARMAEVNQAPIIAEYIKVPGMEEALLLEVGSQVPKHAEVRYELYGNDDRSLAGLTEYLKSPAKGVELSSSYYFDTDGNTVAVWGKMTWTFSGCADSLAVETRVRYPHPAPHAGEGSATLTGASREAAVLVEALSSVAVDVARAEREPLLSKTGLQVPRMPVRFAGEIRLLVVVCEEREEAGRLVLDEEARLPAVSYTHLTLPTSDLV